MKWPLAILLTFFLMFSLSAGKINAQVFINEVRPNGTDSDELDEFIELYNSGSSSEAIGGWKLSDIAGASINTYIIPDPEKQLGPGEFISFRRSETKIILNNDKDSQGNQEGVILQDASGNEKDKIIFGNYDKEDQSISRIPDGIGSWVDYTSLSESKPNIPLATQAPATTSPSTPTPVSTPTPSPTKTPTSKPTPKPTPKPTVRPTSTPAETGLVLSDKSEPTPSPSSEVIVTSEKGSNVPIIAFVLIFFGFLSIGLAFYPFLKSKFKEYNNSNAQNN